MNKHREVDFWLDAYDNPMKPVVSAMREAILKSADVRQRIAGNSDERKGSSCRFIARPQEKMTFEFPHHQPASESDNLLGWRQNSS